MTLQYIKFSNEPNYAITLYFDNTQCNMPSAMRIEAERIQKCIDDKRSFNQSNYRIIIDGQSKTCDSNGVPY